MKISLRILLINFAIVALILGSSALAFYTVMYNVLTSQQSKYLKNSVNEFSSTYRDLVQSTDDDFLALIDEGLEKQFNKDSLYSPNIDFILEESSNHLIFKKQKKSFVALPKSKDFTIDQFLNDNPSVIINEYSANDGSKFYYGKVITNKIINDIASKINSDIALISNDSPLIISNEKNNQLYVFELTKIYKELTRKNKDIYSNGESSKDLVATLVNSPYKLDDHNLSFLIFNSLNEAASLRNNLTDILIIIGIAGVLLSLILSFVFTDKIRKQLSQLISGTAVISKGKFDQRIQVKSKDEIGHLANAFNSMMDELEKNQKAKNEYSEFITLLNQNPSLAEISEASLNKIIETCKFTVGALYTVYDDEIELASSYGFNKDFKYETQSGYFDSVLKNKKELEIFSDKKLPVVSAGFLSLEIKYILIIPILYRSNVIAILELGSLDQPNDEIKDYLSKIKDQLAIGLTNANAFVQLENFVSELKKLNDDYQKQNEQIKKQNDKLLELHKELKEKAEELAIQKEKAEESTKLKSQFLASMSHELRTPMNSILGLTELIIEKASVDDKNKERLEVVLKSGKRLMNLINDILDLSKIEAGKMEIQEDEVLLDELIDDVDNSIRPLVINKKIDLKVTRKSNTKIYVNTDRGKVTQVLINLLGNAVKFTDTGYVELRIATEENKINFDIIDTGIGMSKENLKLIFEEFRQVDGTTTRKYSGTGLGLAICKKISEILKGSISVDSEIGKGSKFTFSIPLKFVESQVETQQQNVNIDTLIKNRRHPILVIDDDSEIRYTIGQYLISKGYEVIYAEDGDKGIEKAIKTQPFAITLDVMLPNRDGWSVLKDLKENPATRDIPVILISIIGDKNIGYGLGAFEYFVKPISHDKLLSAFAKLENLAQKRIEKIVIVDDDELEFEKFKREFKNDDVRIEYIKDSELAFSKILEVQPDLIILDLMMPKVDGVTLSHKLKSNPDTKNIPIILSTARDLSSDERKSLQNIVEDITIKSKGHPLDVLKVVRDRIKLQEDYSAEVDKTIQDKIENLPEPVKTDIDQQLMEIEEEVVEDKRSENSQGLVLIVDDDPDSLFTVNEIVQACECDTIMAKSGAECLSILESKNPDLILLDIMMPVLDGFQVLKRIRQNKRWDKIPVFAVTAKAMLEDREVILKNGFDDYIPKPVNAGIMAFKIEKVFTGQKAN